MSLIIWKAGLINILRNSKLAFCSPAAFSPDEESGPTLMPVHRTLASGAPAWRQIKLKNILVYLTANYEVVQQTSSNDQHKKIIQTKRPRMIIWGLCRYF
jgi:hypothetical protein